MHMSVFPVIMELLLYFLIGKPMELSQQHPHKRRRVLFARGSALKLFSDRLSESQKLTLIFVHNFWQTSLSTLFREINYLSFATFFHITVSSPIPLE